jgi:hypothetical protein
MGQYMKLVNLTKKEVVNPHALHCGAKQVENIDVLGKVMYALCVYHESRGGGDLEEMENFVGRWHGDRIAIVGDYAEDDDISGLDFKLSKVYDDKTFVDISALALEWLGKDY